MAGTGIKSTSVTNYHLGKLREEGMISYRTYNARTIEVHGGSWNKPFWYLAAQLEFDEVGEGG